MPKRIELLFWCENYYIIWLPTLRHFTQYDTGRAQLRSAFHAHIISFGDKYFSIARSSCVECFAIIIICGTRQDVNYRHFKHWLVTWHIGITSVFGRRTSLSCARPVADGWPLKCGQTIRYRSTIQANSAFHPFGVDKWVVSCNWMSATSVRNGAIWWSLWRKGMHGVICR